MKKLQDFSNRVNESLYSHDRTFQALMACYCTKAEKDRIGRILKEWEKHIPYWNALADEAVQAGHLPRLEKYDSVGNQVERVVIPLETRLLRHRVVESGIFKNESEFEKFSKVYFLSQIGESGVTSPLASTDGLIRVLEAKGSEYLKNKYLEQIQSSEIPLAAAQYVTEQNYGSDVGGIQSTAKYVEDDQYKIYAKKWFCSTPEEFLLVAARLSDADPGTKGVSIFLVPHRIPNGKKGGPDYVTNHLSIKRLKDKLSMQSLPTAEIDLEGSLGYLIGYPHEGFSNLMNYVINCSRIHNMANTLGIHRRSFIEARNYASQRSAFGRCIIKYPLVAEKLVNLLACLSSKQVMFCQLLHHIDEHGWMPEDEGTMMWRRLLINMIKYRASARITEMVKDAILVMGAQGTMNDFTILPRLFRDAVSLEIWKGTHNILCLQIMRDLHKFNLLERFNQEVEELIEGWPNDVLVDSKRFYIHNFEVGNKVFTSKNLYDPRWAETHAIRFVNHFAALLETGHLVRAGVKLSDANLLVHASYLMHDWLSDRFAGYVSPTIDNLSGDVCQDLIQEKPIDIDVK